jgi:hypothetical protein
LLQAHSLVVIPPSSHCSDPMKSLYAATADSKGASR